MDFIFVSPLQKLAQRRRKEEEFKEFRPKSTSTSKIVPFQALF
jgi:hypothetical protein